MLASKLQPNQPVYAEYKSVISCNRCKWKGHSFIESSHSFLFERFDNAVHRALVLGGCLHSHLEKILKLLFPQIQKIVHFIYMQFVLNGFRGKKFNSAQG